MRLIHQSDFTLEERLMYKPVVHANAIQSMAMILNKVEYLGNIITFTKVELIGNIFHHFSLVILALIMQSPMDVGRIIVAHE